MAETYVYIILIHMVAATFGLFSLLKSLSDSSELGECERCLLFLLLDCSCMDGRYDAELEALIINQPL